MRTPVLLLVCVALVQPLPAFGQRPKAAPVVASFGGECRGAPFRPSPQLERLIWKTRRREVSPCKRPFCEGVFAYDLNGDARREYFVRLGCGVTGNCTWGVFSDYPARLRGAFVGWFFYIHRRAGAWSVLTAYTRQGGMDGIITTFAHRKQKYVQTSERADEGYYQNSHPYLRRVGVPQCEFTGAAQPDKQPAPDAPDAASHVN